MITTLLSGAAKLAGNIYGGLAQMRQMRNVEKSLADEKASTTSWYNRRYNEDATQRADAQRLLSLTEERMRQRGRAAAGTAAVMGNSDESVAAAKSAGNEALADTVSAIAANEAARKDQIEQQYLGKQADYAAAQRALANQKAAAINNAIQGVNAATAAIAANSKVTKKDA